MNLRHYYYQWVSRWFNAHQFNFTFTKQCFHWNFGPANPKQEQRALPKQNLGPPQPNSLNHDNDFSNSNPMLMLFKVCCFTYENLSFNILVPNAISQMYFLLYKVCFYWKRLNIKNLGEIFLLMDYIIFFPDFIFFFFILSNLKIAIWFGLDFKFDIQKNVKIEVGFF